MNYRDYSLEDFLTDNYFLQWVRHPDSKSSAYWESFRQEHPEKVPLLEEAKEIILSLDFEEDTIPESRIASLQASIHRRIQKDKEPATATMQLTSAPSYRPWYWLAASLILIGGFMAVLYFHVLSPATVEVRSAYGETKTILLPDSSRVTLNANSRLSYAADWEQGDRQVELQGEAFFEVRKLDEPSAETEEKAQGRKFIVHSGGIQVEVLGTTFDVLHRHGKTRVVLTTGQVKVVDTQDRQEVMMQPGDMVKADQQQLVKQVVDPGVHTAWKDNQLVFRGTSLEEIAQLLQDNYNYQVTVEGDSVKQKTFVGIFPADDISVLLQTLAKSLKVKIDQRQKKIFFSNKE